MATEDQPSDILTQLQQQVNHLCSLFYNFTGALQESAPPVSTKGEPVSDRGAQPAFDVEGHTSQMASDIVKAVKHVEELIQGLPDINKTEEQEIEAIAALQAQNKVLDRELAKEMARTESKLGQLRELYRVLAEDEIENRADVVGPPAQPASQLTR